MDGVTADTFFNGRIQVRQHCRGYRFSIDAVIVAGHVKPRAEDVILDLGTGCGIIPLILAFRNPGIRIYGVEIQPELAEIAAFNAKKNKMEDRIRILCMDMKALQTRAIPETIDLVVGNPPYRRAASGRINPNHQRAVARHEIKITLADFVETARRLLRVSGRFVTIYPAERMTDLVVQMRSSGIEPKFMRTIYSDQGGEAKLVLIEGNKGGGPGLKIGSPLFVYRKDGAYTAEMQEMFAIHESAY